MNSNTNLAESAIQAGEAALQHYGVKGMKWGKWNAETSRKYSGGSKGRQPSSGAKKPSVMKTTLSAGSSRVKAFAKSKRDSMRANHESRKAERAERNAARKELGMSRKQYDKLRATTLKSHDPEVVAKGMHTLTDKELNDKIDRLQREAKVSNLASTQKKQRYEAKKARNEAITKHPIYQIGESTAKQAVNEIGMTVVKKGINPVVEQRVSHAARKAQEAFNTKIANEIVSDTKHKNTVAKAASVKKTTVANVNTSRNEFKQKNVKSKKPAA